MADEKLTRNTYLSKNAGNFPAQADVMGKTFLKVDDLRYGTNPHQTAALYKPAGRQTAIGDMVVVKNGKSGLSQTNLEDISFSLNIVKFFDQPACACMKHVNPCGAAIAAPGEPLLAVYVRARDCDPRAAFGSVIAFNVKVDAKTAREIMKTFVECVVAPAYDQEAITVFTDPEAKREAITSAFYSKVFGRLVKESGAKFLLHGTILTDIEETVAGIKRQHNILAQLGISTEQAYGYSVLEPLKTLRKDGVREVAKILDLPPAVWRRMPS